MASLALAALTLTGLLLTGCVKEPTTALVYGKEVDRETVAAELQKAMGPNDSPALIQREEAVLREATRVIRGRPVVDVLSTSEVTVVEKIESTHQWQIKDVERLQNYDPSNPTNTPPPIIREDHKCWSKETLDREECELVPTPLMNLRAGRTIDERLQPFAQFQQTAAAPEKTISYHNLHTRSYVGSPPEAVANAANCRGLPHCQLHITEIEFDRVNWADSPEGYKIHYKLRVSQDVPEMSRFLQSCQQGSVQVQQPGQDPKSSPRFLVTYCETVRDFMPGQ
jgi:hypothetical protein